MIINEELTERLQEINENKASLSNKKIADILGRDLPRAFKYVYDQTTLLYDDLKRIENSNNTDMILPITGGSDNVTIINISLRDDLKKDVDWPEVFDEAVDAGYLKCPAPRGKKKIVPLNKFKTGSNIIDMILSNYSDNCAYDILFSPVFSLLSLDTRFSSVSRRMFGNDSLLITLNALSRKHFPLIAALGRDFKKSELPRKFKRLNGFLNIKGICQSEVYLIKLCFIESFLNGILKHDAFDVTTEYRTTEELYNLHCTDGSAYMLDWFNPYK